MTTLLAFIATLALLIVVHEYGHYRIAVACGVKVLRFSVGFGRVIWRRQRGETEFALSALPLGGYVKMLDTREGEVPADERYRAFDQRPLWQRSAIVMAGPLANLLLAVLLYAAAHWVGVDEPKALLGSPLQGSMAERAGFVAGDWVQSTVRGDEQPVAVKSMNDFRWRLTEAALHGEPVTVLSSDANGRAERRTVLPLQELSPRDVDAELMRRIGLPSSYSEPLIGRVMDGGPAQLAGLREGDRVLRVDGEPIEDAAQLRQAIRAAQNDGAPLTMRWVVQRGGQTLELPVIPALRSEAGGTVPRIEAYIGQAPAMVNVRYGAVEGLTHALERTWDVSVLSVQMLGRMLIGEASLRNLSGPITIADYAGQSVEQGFAYYLGFLALVSVSLGVLNLLPLPMLDGGHLMYHLFEALTGHPVSDVWLNRLQRGGMAVMLMMMSLALYNDVARLLGLH